MRSSDFNFSTGFKSIGFIRLLLEVRVSFAVFRSISNSFLCGDNWFFSFREQTLILRQWGFRRSFILNLKRSFSFSLLSFPLNLYFSQQLSLSLNLPHFPSPFRIPSVSFLIRSVSHIIHYNYSALTSALASNTSSNSLWSLRLHLRTHPHHIQSSTEKPILHLIQKITFPSSWTPPTQSNS